MGPTKYVPADDARENKSSSRFRNNQSSHLGSIYKPNTGLYYYGRVQPGKERGKIMQFMAEPECVKWYLRNFAIVCAWLIPMCMMSHAETKAQNQGKSDPQPMKQPWYKGVITYIFCRHYVK